ncbi:MAG: ATP-dependent DNA helicase RecG [Paludibacteraceae bacterium]|nr:ATP-dependent DNA helicase RecG [Paludibacteraceae bacterium]
MDFSTQDIKFLPGVGPKKAELFNKELSIFTVEDLLRHYPYKYVDRSRFYKIRELKADMAFVQIRGQFLRFEKIGEGKKQRLSAMFSDGENTIELVWFRGVRFVIDKYKPGIDYVAFGKPALFNGKFNLLHPDIETVSQLPPPEEMGFQPYYNTSEKMKNHFLNSKAIQKIIYPLIKKLEAGIPETLPSYVLQKFKLMNLTESLINIHFPKDEAVLSRARQRLKFEELFYIQLDILRQRKWREQRFSGFVFKRVGSYFNDFYTNHLPFALTNAQKKVIREIRTDMSSGKQMNRLLQGDVGSGKTVVALLTMLIALDNGYQACLMAPTEILANQHLATISELLDGMNVQISLLTGSTKKKDRETIHQKLQNGEMQIIIGTHALIENTVQFKNLGFVIIDEQHRFGVAQRSRLWTKNEHPPHIMVMTATPIPRTLAMTVYGDLSVSVIDELPPGRKSIQTFHYYESKRNSLIGFLGKQINAGRQVYVVYPLIEESEKLDFRYLEEGYEFWKEIFPNFKISMVHGKMKPAEKDAHMQKFVSGETQIMVATTVIEVGVNVPNASVMIIESAERFGLSQLHQLRGRVGRGAEQSYCILLTGVRLSSDTRKRMEIMTRTNDGFEISEADLQLRGPGDMEGTQQSGIPFELKIADLAKDGQVLGIARNMAWDILEEDPTLSFEKNRMMGFQLKKMKTNPVNWSAIS